MWIKQLLAYKTNMLGVMAIAIVTSMTTVAAQNWLMTWNDPAPSVVPSLTTSASDALKCTNGVYSPVQRKCVSKEVFDGEMKRLFAALGIDASIYSKNAGTN